MLKHNGRTLAAILAAIALPASAALSAEAGDPLPPPSPGAEHHTNPVTQESTIAYKCPAGLRGALIRKIDVHLGSGDIVAARLSLNGRAVKPSVNIALKDALSRFDSISTMVPQCGLRSDIIIVGGRVNSEPWLAQLSWSATHLRTDLFGRDHSQTPRPVHR